MVVPVGVAWAFRSHIRRQLWVPLAALLAHGMQLSLLDSRSSKWYEPVRHRWYQRQHYESEYA